MSRDVPAKKSPASPAIVDCWNRIGVYGDSSCPLLPTHVHCRNCPVYSAAAIQVLDREQSMDGREVADLRDIHSLPHRRNGVVLGLANVRGELLVCVSLAQLLGIDALAPVVTRHQRIVNGRLLVLRDAGGRLAFPVDEAHGSERFDERDLQAVPTTVAKAAARYSRAVLPWREHAVGLLDDQLLFHSLNRSLG